MTCNRAAQSQGIRHVEMFVFAAMEKPRICRSCVDTGPWSNTKENEKEGSFHVDVQTVSPQLHACPLENKKLPI